MTNPYTNIEFSEDQWDDILGKYTDTDVDKKDINTVWEKIKDSTPIDGGSGTHVCHSIREIDDVRYACFWYFPTYPNTTFSEVPQLITVQTPRKPVNKYPTRQMDLFFQEEENGEYFYDDE